MDAKTTPTFNTHNLGSAQVGCLKALLDHSGLPAWYAGCGWAWETPSRTDRVMRSLVARGLVTEEATSMYSDWGKYRLAEGAREALRADLGLFGWTSGRVL